MTSKRVLVLVTVLVIGGGLLLALPGSPSADLVLMRGNSDASGDHVMLAEFYVFTTRRIIGIVMLLVASLLVAGVVGFRLARR